MWRADQGEGEGEGSPGDMVSHLGKAALLLCSWVSMGKKTAQSGGVGTPLRERLPSSPVLPANIETEEEKKKPSLGRREGGH